MPRYHPGNALAGTRFGGTVDNRTTTATVVELHGGRRRHPQHNA
jgi:hypothetical protein